MAVLTDLDVIFIGSRKNDKQAILAIPAQAAANKPGILCLQEVDDSGVVGEVYIWPDSASALRYGTAIPTNQDGEGTVIGTGVSTLDGAFDGGTFIDSAAATGLGNCLRVGGAATLDKIEFYHDGSNATIAAMADDLYLAAAGGDINFSGDNIAGAGSITGTSADIVTGELTCGSINRTTGTLTLEIAGTAEVSVTSSATTLGGNLDVNTTGEVTAGSVNRASGNLTLEIAGTAVVTVAAAAVTLAQDLDVNTTGEVTAGSINRAAGSLTLEIAGTAEQTITATETTFGGNIILPSAGTITSAGADIDFGAENLLTTGNVILGADGTSSVGRIGLGVSGISDAYIEFDGSTLNFYDTTVGAYTLSQLATGTVLNPSVTGDLTLADGSITVTDADAATSFSVTNDSLINSGGPLALIDGGGLTDQVLLALDADVITTGNFLTCDRSGVQFAIKRYGEVEIAGLDATDMITVTKGHIQLEDGKIEIDSDSNIGSHIITNFSGQSVSTLLVHNNHTTGTSKALEVIQDATGAAWGIDLLHDGDEPALYMHAATARTGYGIHCLATNQEAERLFYVSGAATAASDEGTVEINSSGALAAGGNLLRVVSSGTNAAASFAVEIVTSGNVVNATDGAALRIDHTGTAGAGIVYAMYLNSTNDYALKINAGQSDILGDVNFGVAGTGVDVTFFGENAGKHMWYDMNGNTDGELILIDTSILFDQTNCDYRLDAASDALLLDEVNDHASGAFTIGASGTNGLDLIWQSATAGDLVTFNAGSETCTFTDVPVTLTGADSSGALLTVTGIDTSTDSDSIVVTHQGAGAALKVTTGEADSQGIEVVTCASSVVSQVLIDGVTNNWLGNDGVGMLHVKNDGTMAHANSSNVLIAGSGSVAANARGSCLRITETGANAADAFAVDINTTNNDGLLIETGAVADINLKLTGLDAQVGQMIHVDGSTTNGWDGANDTGCLHVNTKVLNNAGAAALFVDHAGQPISSAEGACARFVQSTGSAQTNAYLVQIDAVATGGALNVSSGHSIFDEKVTFTAGQQSSAVAVTSSATKASAAVPAGTTFVAVTSSGTATHYVELPACVVGNVVWLYVGATGYELIANDSTTEYLNGQKSADSDDASSSVAGNTLVRAICVDSTHWLANQFDTAGTESVLETATS